MEYQQQIMVRAVQNQQLDLLREIVIKEPYFFELDCISSYEEINAILALFTVVNVEMRTVYQLRTGTVYYLLSTGMRIQAVCHKINDPLPAVKKNIMCKTSNHYRKKETGHFKGKIGNIIGSERLGEPKGKVFGEISHPSSNFYIATWPFHQVPQSILTNIRNHQSDKTKFLSKFSVLSHIPKPSLYQQLNKFQILSLSFQQTVYSPGFRDQSVIFLQKGQIQLQNHNIKSIIVNQNSIIGINKVSSDEKAICFSNRCICYKIQFQELMAMIELFEGKSSRQNQENVNNNMSLRYEYLSTHISPNYRQVSGRKTDSNNLSELKRKLIQSRKYDPTSEQNSRKERLRQHFSNHINQKYEAYTSTIPKQLNAKQQYPIIFMLKSLQPKKPEYAQINRKLKNVRMRKLNGKMNSFLKHSDRLLIDSEENQGLRKEFMNQTKQKNIRSKLSMRMRMIGAGDSLYSR